MKAKHSRLRRLFETLKLIFSPWRWFKKKDEVVVQMQEDAQEEQAPAEAQAQAQAQQAAGNDNASPDERLRRKIHRDVLTPVSLHVSAEEQAIQGRRATLVRRESDLNDELEIARSLSTPQVFEKYQESLLRDASPLPKPLIPRKKKKKVKEKVDELSKNRREKVHQIDGELFDNSQAQQLAQIELAHVADKRRLKDLFQKGKAQPLNRKERQERTELQEKILIYKARKSLDSMSAELERMQDQAREENDDDRVAHIDRIFQVQFKADNFDDTRLAFNQLAEQTGLFECVGAGHARRNYEQVLMVSPREMDSQLESQIHVLHQKMLAMEKSLLASELRILIKAYQELDPEQQCSEEEFSLRKNILGYAKTLQTNIGKNESRRLQFLNENVIEGKLRQLETHFGTAGEPKETNYNLFNTALAALRKILPKSRKNTFAPTPKRKNPNDRRKCKTPRAPSRNASFSMI